MQPLAIDPSESVRRGEARPHAACAPELAWVERQTGKKLTTLFADEDGAEPWREIADLTAAVAQALEIENALAPEPGMAFVPTRRSDDDEGDTPTILSSAVLGLFPLGLGVQAVKS